MGSSAGVRVAGSRVVVAWVFVVVAVAAIYGLAALNGSSLDQRVSYLIQQLRTPWGETFMRLVTHLGDALVLVMVALAAALACRAARLPRAALFCLSTALGSPLNFAIKLLFVRHRPPTALVLTGVTATGSSFPSGHTMSAVLSYGFLALLVSSHRARGGSTAWLSGGLIFLPLLVGFSRTYLGVHWPTDVLAGWLSGMVLLLGLSALYRLKTEPGPAPVLARMDVVK